MQNNVTLSVCHCVNLRRTTNYLTEFYTRTLEPCGLTLPQFSLLKNIHALQDGSTTAIAHKVRLEHCTLVRNLKHLQEMGLLMNTREAGRKCCVWGLTEKGQQALATGIPLWQTAQKRVAEALGEEGLEQLNTMLIRLQSLKEVQ